MPTAGIHLRLKESSCFLKGFWALEIGSRKNFGEYNGLYDQVWSPYGQIMSYPIPFPI